MLGSGTMAWVIKGPREASQLPWHSIRRPSAQLPHSSPEGAASVSRHASERQIVLTDGSQSI
jgi:hypothetical protein